MAGAENLTTYTFGTHTAQHKFCKVCGITPFYVPRSNPDGYAVTLDCLDADCRPQQPEFRHYDGRNWEQAHQQTGIQKLSAP